MKSSSKINSLAVFALGRRRNGLYSTWCLANTLSKRWLYGASRSIMINSLPDRSCKVTEGCCDKGCFGFATSTMGISVWCQICHSAEETESSMIQAASMEPCWSCRVRLTVVSTKSSRLIFGKRAWYFNRIFFISNSNSESVIPIRTEPVSISWDLPKVSMAIAAVTVFRA